MGEVVDFNKKKRELKRKKQLEEELQSSGYYRPKSTDDKIKDALKKFGSHRKNKQHEKDKEDK